MLNKCMKRLSCGTNYPYYKVEVAPAEIGVLSNITANMSAFHIGKGDDCKHYSKDSYYSMYNVQLEVMRCSLAEHDIIYKYIPSGSSHTIFHDVYWDTFCGML